MVDPDTLHLLEAIEDRNRRVEADKAWETSFTRMIALSTITYFVALIFMISTGLQQPFLNACIPAIGFLLSLQTVPIAKRWWLRKYT